MSVYPSDAQQGLLVAGASVGCGKTVVTTGLAGALKALDIQAQALKPLDFAPPHSVRPTSDQQFMETVLRPLHPVNREEIVTVESPRALSHIQWNRVLETCRKRLWPTLIECPGAVASPWKFIEDQVMDVADMGRLLDLPVLLVCRKTPDIIAEAAPALTYLQDRGTIVSGWVAVETTPAKTPDWDEDTRFLHARYHTPFLGDIAYSPSISVSALQQGNLIRSVEAGIDLLPIQQAMSLVLF